MIREIARELPGFVTEDGDRYFNLRYGIRFGMTTDEVIRIERMRGFGYRSPESLDNWEIYDYGNKYHLTFEAQRETVGGLKCWCFEYNFTKDTQLLYQFSFGFGGQNPAIYFPLRQALELKHGPADPAAASSEYYSEQEEQFNRNHLCWNLPEDGEHFIAVDLWMTIVNNCCLVYERKSRRKDPEG